VQQARLVAQAAIRVLIRHRFARRRVALVVAHWQLVVLSLTLLEASVVIWLAVLAILK
jgi:hypothetical protein